MKAEGKDQGHDQSFGTSRMLVLRSEDALLAAVEVNWAPMEVAGHHGFSSVPFLGVAERHPFVKDLSLVLSPECV